MPWKINILAEERHRFIRMVLQKSKPIAELCCDFGISRKTGFKWLSRFLKNGKPGLLNQSTRPIRSPGSTDQKWQKAIATLRDERPHWGAKKIFAKLRQRHPRARLPNVRTINRLLKKLGFIPRQVTRSRSGPKLSQHRLTVPKRPNDVWTIDFKGWFRTGNGTRIDPLTVRDLHSRFILGISLLQDQRDEPVRREMARLFKEYGLPKVIRTDHGVPFSGVGALDLSRLSVWWLRLGIRVEFTRRGCPQDNGSHEQMHRVYKAEVAPAATRQAQLRRTRKWITDYNNQRPHEMLDQEVPSAFYRPSRKAYTVALPELKYPNSWTTRRVTTRGYIWWHGQRRMVGRAFERQCLGVKRRISGVYEVYLGRQLLGELWDKDKGGMRPARWAKPHEITS